ncbi:MAG: F0F1 ATP synthase subunit alpha [Oscillospiraceae bacterium]|nr:F0F1 ATP synthase subunit alpha [Oscillospiraceae bacterium]
MAINASEIISVLKSEIADFDRKTALTETGTVVSAGDGIATVFGLQNVMYGELVEFENGTRGIVQNIEMKTVGVVMLGSDRGITEGTQVMRTKKRAGVAVSNNMQGRVLSALGAAIDGGPDIIAEDFYPIEREAAGVADRKSVSVPLETGILSIDAMFPIGRGQRELIIGDRQTGKTSIAVDTIINQRDKNVVCVYVAIGQKSSTVAKVVSMLKKHHAMEYTVVVSASASEPAPVQYIAPYSGTAIAEYFMDQGKDVLIVYDDLSKHAVAYRTMSLLLHRPPGREAYPGDVFYLHSRLLERSCRLEERLGGGSITALPIIETQAGDVSAYIPTNVISITDGQIFLESELFNAGMRPAVNVGLSVSRVGGAAQTKAMKKVSGKMRIDLAQFRELEVFTQFSSDLDPNTKALLDHGHVLMELLKQPLYEPIPLWEQVVILAAASDGALDDMELKKLSGFRKSLMQYILGNYPEIPESITNTKEITPEQIAQIAEITAAYKEQVSPNG